MPGNSKAALPAYRKFGRFGKYEFAWDKNDAESRFKLHLNTVGIEETESEPGNLWIAGNTLFINTTEMAGQQAVIEV